MKKLLFQLLLKFRDIFKRFGIYQRYLPYLSIILIALVVCLFGIELFTELTENLYSPQLTTVDAAISEYLMSLRSSGLTDVMVLITHLGDLYAYLIFFLLFTLFFLYKFRSWKYAVQLGLVILIAGGINRILKNIFDRARPQSDPLMIVDSLSYPSGHAMSAIAFYGFLIYLFTEFEIKLWLRSLLIFLLCILIAGIGLSRVYLGVHYPTDVLGGYIAGLVWLIFCIVIFNVISFYRREIRNYS